MGVNVNSVIWGMSPHYYHVAPPVMQPLAVPVKAKITQQPPTIQDREDVVKNSVGVKTLIQTKSLNDLH